MSVTAAQRGLHRPIHDDTCFPNTKPKVDTASMAPASAYAAACARCRVHLRGEASAQRLATLASTEQLAPPARRSPLVSHHNALAASTTCHAAVLMPGRSAAPTAPSAGVHCTWWQVQRRSTCRRCCDAALRSTRPRAALDASSSATSATRARGAASQRVLAVEVRERLLDSAGGPTAALALLTSRRAGRLDVETGAQLLAQLCEGEPQRGALELVLSRMDGLQLPPAVARSVLRAFLAGDCTDRALSLFRQLQAAGVSLAPATYTDLIAALARRHATARAGGDTSAGRAALSLWEEVRNSSSPLDAAAFNAAASAFLATGQVQRAYDLVADMSEQGLSPGIRMFNILLTAAGRARDLARVDTVLEDMRSSGLPPDKTTHGAVVSALVRCGQLERAASALRDAQRATPPPGVRAYTALVQGHAAAGDFDAALGVIADMRSAGVEPNVVTYTVLMDGLVRAERLADAAAMLDGIQRRDIKANAVTFNTLLRGYARRGRVNDALQFYARMTKLGVQPSVVTFNTLLLACSRSGNVGTANQVLARMQAAGITPDVVSVTSLIACASRVGDVASASAFASKALNEWRLVLDAPAYNALLTCLAFANKHDEASALLARMRAAGVQPTLASFGSLVAGAARAGDLDGALAAYRDACASGIMPDVRMYDVLLDACLRAGRFELGVDLLSDMEQRGTALPEDVRGKYRRLLETLAATPGPLSLRGAGRVPRRTQAGAPGGRVPVAAPVPGATSGIERLKWWLGLPSRYYSE